jgi:hypothetical protein
MESCDGCELLCANLLDTAIFPLPIQDFYQGVIAFYAPEARVFGVLKKPMLSVDSGG